VRLAVNDGVQSVSPPGQHFGAGLFVWDNGRASDRVHPEQESLAMGLVVGINRHITHWPDDWGFECNGLITSIEEGGHLCRVPNWRCEAWWDGVLVLSTPARLEL
jgi:hypothetical protein